MKRTAGLRSLITTDSGMAGFLKKKYMSGKRAGFVSRPDAQDDQALNMVVQAVHTDISQAEARGVAGLMTYSAAISIMCDLKRPRFAAMIWGKMQAFGHVPGIHAYNALLACHARSGDLVSFHSVWRRLLVSGLDWQREPLVFCTLFAAFSKTPLDRGRAKLDSIYRAAQACLPEPIDIKVIEAYIHALPSIGTAEALQLVDTYAQSGLSRARCYTALLKPCAKCGNVQLATLLWPRIDQVHRTNNVWSWLLQAHAVAENKQFEGSAATRGQAALLGTAAPDVSLSGGPEPTDKNADAYPTAKSIFRDMRTARVAPLPGALAAVVGTSRTVKDAEGVFQYCLVTFPDSVNILVRTAMLNQYVRASDWDRVAAFYNRFPGVAHCKRGIEVKQQLRRVMQGRS
ncbi:hypothetical protein DIPPA_27286 [Diplonema papillatum]|nr:hypothetical protein DIPPA_27286 [Diplonema papillatum]